MIILRPSPLFLHAVGMMITTSTTMPVASAFTVYGDTSICPEVPNEVLTNPACDASVDFEMCSYPDDVQYCCGEEHETMCVCDKGIWSCGNECDVVICDDEDIVPPAEEGEHEPTQPPKSHERNLLRGGTNEEQDEEEQRGISNLHRILSGCTNNHQDCQYWASIGECAKNPAYMEPQCGAFCLSGCCSDAHQDCPYWASIGECNKNPGYMLSNCRKSCGTCAGGGGGGGGSQTCPKKKVRIHRFCINGDCDSGAEAEVQLRLNGQKYFPQRSSDCRQEDSGYCDLREGQCHSLHNPSWVGGLTHRSMSVGLEEHDDWSENDSYHVSLPSSQWHSSTCEPYEVQFSRNFKEERVNSICASLEVTGEPVPGLSATGGVQACSTWTSPAESFIWFMEVYPDN